MIEAKVTGFLKKVEFRVARTSFKNEYISFTIIYSDKKTLCCVCFDENIVKTFKENRESLMGKKLELNGTIDISHTRVSPMIYNTRIILNCMSIKLIVDDLV